MQGIEILELWKIRKIEVGGDQCRAYDTKIEFIIHPDEVKRILESMGYARDGPDQQVAA